MVVGFAVWRFVVGRVEFDEGRAGLCGDGSNGRDGEGEEVRFRVRGG